MLANGAQLPPLQNAAPPAVQKPVVAKPPAGADGAVMNTGKTVPEGKIAVWDVDAVVFKSKSDVKDVPVAPMPQKSANVFWVGGNHTSFSKKPHPTFTVQKEAAPAPVEKKAVEKPAKKAAEKPVKKDAEKKVDTSKPVVNEIIYADKELPKNDPTKYWRNAKKKEWKGETCPICLCEFEEDEVAATKKDSDDYPVALRKCHHAFHRGCMQSTLENTGGPGGSLKCPVCCAMYGTFYGDQPINGQMSIQLTSFHLPGFPKNNTIVIQYTFPNGIQGPEHQHPGHPYTGTMRQAFLPDTEEGREVLELLKIAFRRRLIFTVGQSITTGVDNTVVWHGIHHKTHHQPNKAHGYPDPTYFSRVKEELASFGVLSNPVESESESESSESEPEDVDMEKKSEESKEEEEKVVSEKIKVAPVPAKKFYFCSDEDEEMPDAPKTEEKKKPTFDFSDSDDLPPPKPKAKDPSRKKAPPKKNPFLTDSEDDIPKKSKPKKGTHKTKPIVISSSDDDFFPKKTKAKEASQSSEIKFVPKTKKKPVKKTFVLENSSDEEFDAPTKDYCFHASAEIPSWNHSTEIPKKAMGNFNFNSSSDDDLS